MPVEVRFEGIVTDNFLFHIHRFDDLPTANVMDDSIIRYAYTNMQLTTS